MNENVILLTKTDYLKIKGLIDHHQNADLDDLEMELDRAEIVPENEKINFFVRLGSTVTYLNVDENKKMTITVVLPEDTNSQEGKISILAPLGSALIGLRVDQEIKWNFPGGKEKTLKILEVR
jgi:regulator of nucleoside diphosphate kinase